MSDLQRIYLSPPHLDAAEREQVLNVLQEGWIAPVGPALDRFERQLEAQFGYPYILALNSGTAALHLAVKLCGIGPGDRVLIGSFTFCAAANVVLYERGIPVFMDSEPRSWNLDVQLLEEYLFRLSRKEMPKALIVTHVYGMPADMQRIAQVCQIHSIRLIEDAAEALGSAIGGQAVGTWGDFGVVSFNGNKIVTTGGGGGLICRNNEHYSRAGYLATQAKGAESHYEHEELGYNYRLSTVLAGIGLGQLSRFEWFFRRKRTLYDRYRQSLGVTGVFDFQEEKEGHLSNRWLTTLTIRPAFAEQIQPADIIQALDERSIEARRLWKPLHLQPLYRNAQYMGLAVAEDLFDRGVCLPSGTGLKDEEQDRVIGVILDLLSQQGLAKG